MTILNTNETHTKSLLDFGDISKIISETSKTKEWVNLQQTFNSKSTIVIVGHGGNLAVSDHIAADITRLTNFSKKTLCPGSAIIATSFINDSSFEDWLVCWFKSQPIDFSNTLIIGISSSGRSKDIQNLFNYANNYDIYTSLITAKASEIISSNQVITNCNSYHSSELVALGLGYQLVHGYGSECPKIG